MTKLIQWLQAHPRWNILLLAVFYPLVVLPHEWVGLTLNEVIFKGVPRPTYNRIILVGALLVLGLYVGLFIRNVSKGTQQRQQWFYLVATVLFAGYTVYALFVINVEVVHFFQYALFAVLCYPLVGNFLLALLWTTLMGSIDEAYQYFYLSPERTDYYDFNDVVTNLLGGAFGLILLRSYEVRGTLLKASDFVKTKTFGFLCLYVILFTGVVRTNVLDWYPSENATPRYLMVKKIPESWWSFIPPDVTYHIMQPLEGIVVTLGLLFFYRYVGR